MIYRGVIERYRKYLPVSDKTPVISILEGNTPLVPSPYLSSILGRGFEVYLKYEGLNPTGSFKDRGMTVAVSKSVEEGSKAIICASTGNTSASAAAYAARAKIKCAVLIPKGAIALGKLAQALIHGAKVVAVDGNFDDAFNLVKEIREKYPITLVNSINPNRIEGQKTASFEICDNLGDAPDFQCMPVGNAGNITAYWKGYKEYKDKGVSSKLPKMCGFQAEGAAPIVRGKRIEKPETIATAIRIGNPASWKGAEAARDESGGLIDMVSDKDIVQAYQILASKEGVFVEPASAASVAGLLKLFQQGYFNKQQTIPRQARDPSSRDPERSRRANNKQQTTRIVCILTGHGLKDPDRAIKTVKEPKVIPAKLDAVVGEIGL